MTKEAIFWLKNGRDCGIVTLQMWKRLHTSAICSTHRNDGLEAVKYLFGFSGVCRLAYKIEIWRKHT